MGTKSINEFLTSIADGATVRYIGSGTDSDAYTVGEYVYRFPHNDAAFLQYKREKQICDLVRSAVSVAIPKIETCEQSGFKYSRHKMIMGRKWHWHIFSFRPIKQARLADSIARVLSELHSVDVSGLSRQAPEADNFQYIDIDKIIPKIKPFLNARTLRFFVKKYNSIVQKPVPASDMVLCHMGLKGANSVVDDAGRLVGLFDFGNAGVHERWRDLGVIFTGKNKRLFRMVRRRYCKYAGVEYRRHRIEDLASVEHFAKKRWLNADGSLRDLTERQIKRYLAHALALFHNMPMRMRRVIYWQLTFNAWRSGK